MKTINETPNAHHWPRHAVKSVETRKRDLVIRISNWMKDRDEPAFDVECYIGGIYDFNESKTFTRWNGCDKPQKTIEQCKREAIAFAQSQIAKLL